MPKQELDTFLKKPSHKAAKDLGKALFLEELDIESKQKMLDQAFNRTNHTDTEAILNLWAVACMLKDDIPVVRKIEAVRASLDDAELNKPDLDEWIRMVYKDKYISDELINFLEPEFIQHSRVSVEIKKEITDKTLRSKNA
jgi:hypothetical protein